MLIKLDYIVDRQKRKVEFNNQYLTFDLATVTLRVKTVGVYIYVSINICISVLLTDLVDYT